VRTILVSGASGIVGYGILRSLRQSKQQLRLVGTTIFSDSAAPAFSDVVELAVPTEQEGYLEWLEAVIRRHEVDLVVPSIEVDVYKWNESRAVIAEAGALAVLNSPRLIDLCRDKWLMYEELTRVATDLAIPSRLDGTFEELSREYSLPFLLKPRRGFASRGIVKVEDEATFRRHREQLGPVLMAQPIVGAPDEEYTVSGFFDEDSGLCCHFSLRRTLSPEGFTQHADVLDLDGAAEVLGRLGSAFQAVGPTNFQFRVHDGDLKLLEVNPRISSATSIRTAFGYNESLMCVDFYLDRRRPSQPPTLRGSAVRYVEEALFFDRDRR
jgi:carbamoyl-phosphate synthase large subunit